MNTYHSERKVPMRKCSGCGEHFPKNALIRVLRTPDEKIILDLTGKASGRGAYLCKNPDCLRKAKKGRRLEAALSVKIPDEVYQKLEEELTVGT